MSLISSLSVSRGINHNKHETIAELFHSIHYFHSNMFNFNSKMFDFNKLLDFYAYGCCSLQVLHLPGDAVVPFLTYMSEYRRTIVQ